MKILQIITRFDTVYGAQRHVIDLSTHLSRLGHDIQVLSGSVGASALECNTAGIKVHEWKILKHKLSLVSDIKCIVELVRFLRIEKPDVVASHSSKAGIISRVACWWCKVPNTFTAHGWSFEDGIPYKSRMLFLTIEKIVGLITDKVIVVAEAGKEFAIKKGVMPAKKMVVIYYGVTDRKSSKFDRATGLFTMVMVAGLRPQKDHMTLIKALNRLKEFEWQIFFLGDGELEHEIKNEVNCFGMADRCIFPGAISDVASYLATSDLMVLTTNWEGLPISILEGLAYSLPVVATDVAGVKEEVIDGYNGKLVKRNNEQDVYDALKYFFSDRSRTKEMGTRSRAHYEKNFKLEVMVENTLALYNRITHT